MSIFRLLIALVAVATVSPSFAQIYRWDNGQVIPGTEGITPGPGVDLQLWNTATKNLRFADFKGDLAGTDFWGSWLDDARFVEADLTGARFIDSVLSDAEFMNATIAGANLMCTTHNGFTSEQLYSTKSYIQHDLHGISFKAGIEICRDDLSGWDFSRQNLQDSNFSGAILANADFTDAMTGRSRLTLSAQQLYSTASYKSRDLREVALEGDDGNFDGWNFGGQDLTGARLVSNVMRNADLSNANLTRASFSNNSILVGTKFVGSILMDTVFDQSDLSGSDISFADTRGAVMVTTGTIARNTILPRGEVIGIDLSEHDQLVIRDDDGVAEPPPVFWSGPRDPISIRVEDHFRMYDGGELELMFDSDSWGSLIKFQPGTPVELGGTLELTFSDDTAIATQVGRTIRVFDWTGVIPTGRFHVASPYMWDLSKLYTTGEVTLVAVPEPSTFPIASLAVATVIHAVLHRRRRRLK